MNIVVDASFVVSALLDSGEEGDWAHGVLFSNNLSAPHLMLAEAANIIRRSASAGLVTQDSAALAHRDLLDLRFAAFPYRPFGERVWELRHNLTAYDGWYVALAEWLGAPLATVDVKLSRASGPECGFLLP